MGRRIIRSAHRISALGDDRVAKRHDCPDRHLAVRSGLSGKIERTAHWRRQRKCLS
jgi:hypothetical protein